MDANELKREAERLEQSINRAKQLGMYSSKSRPAAPSPTPTSPGPLGVAQTAGPRDAGKTQMGPSAARLALPFWEKILESGGRVLGAQGRRPPAADCGPSQYLPPGLL